MTTLTDEKNEEAPAPTLNSGADREAIAKLIDPAAFNDIHIARVAAHRRQKTAFEKADAILSLHRAVDGGAAIEQCARELEAAFPDHAWLNAACATIRSMALPRVSTGGAAGEPVAWLDIRTANLGWQNRIVATNPQFVEDNGPENFVALYAFPRSDGGAP